MTGCVVFCVTIFCIIVSITTQKLSNYLDKVNPCIGAQNCGDCIAIGKDCVWCADPSYAVENKARCNLLTAHSNCTDENRVSPQSLLDRVQDKEPQDGTNTEDPVQLQPQIVKLIIRPNDPQNFTVKFRVANNYPVDLYYLMDLSYSMKNTKDKLADAALLIAKEMRNITTDLRLGFGSFIDKALMPYICLSMNEDNTSVVQCPINDEEELDPTYGFKNHQSLTENASLFEEAVLRTNMSYSVDAPNGGLDAIMQAIVCEKQIRWRNPSRRILLYSSDTGFHTAGDGKLGGVFKRNDEECHLVNDMYSESTTQDYPSVSQIASKIKEKNVNIIFGVKAKTVKDYNRLQNVIPGSEIGILAADSSNIVRLVSENYNKITSKVEMISSNKVKNVNLRFFTNCEEKDQELKESNSCEGLKVGDTVSFEVEIKVTDCPPDSSNVSRVFAIKPVGLSDSVEVRMEIICKCDCEKENNIDSPKCNNHGSYVCGDCECNPNYYGKSCGCIVEDQTSQELEKNCIDPQNFKKCSERGKCVCGECECNKRTTQSLERYSGQWCECDHYNCPFFGGALCGGTTHGVCNCGKCQCSPQFTGENCGCPTATDLCKASDGSVCGGPDRGECVCNSCVCKPESNYQGRTCEDCKDCSLICRWNKACVQCVAYGTGEFKDSCQQCKAKDHITVANALPEGYNSCEFKDEDDCIFYFTYSNENNKLKIVAKQDKDCPEKPDVVAIVLGVMGGVLGIGLFILVAFKVGRDVKDSMEVAKFEKERLGPKTIEQDNKIYIPPVTHFHNPLFKKLTSKKNVPETKLLDKEHQSK